MNKLNMGIIVTVVPLAVAVAAILGFFGATSPTGLTPDVRPDHQTPAMTTFNVEVRTVDGTDRLMNVGGEPNGSFVSCPACTLRLVITNNGQNAHNIVIPATGASSGSIAPGATATIDIVKDELGTIMYESEGRSNEISGEVKIVRVSG